MARTASKTGRKVASAKTGRKVARTASKTGRKVASATRKTGRKVARTTARPRERLLPNHSSSLSEEPRPYPPGFFFVVGNWGEIGYCWQEELTCGGSTVSILICGEV